MNNNVPVDENYLEKSFSDISIFLNYLNAINPANLTKSNKSKLNNVFEKLGCLISYHKLCDKKGYQQYRIDKSLWKGHIVLKYLFEDFITYNNVKQQGLYCTICKMFFPNNSDALLSHVCEQWHLKKYADSKNRLNKTIWGNFIIDKLAYEKYIELMFDNIYCKLCCTEFPHSHVHLIGHINSKEHYENFKSIVNFKYDFDKRFQSSLNNLPVNNCRLDEFVGESISQTNLMSSNKSDISNDYHCFTNNDFSEISSSDNEFHHHFMNKVMCIITEIKFYCQPCRYYELCVTRKSVETHEKSRKHKMLCRHDCQIRFCSTCSIYFCCSSNFFSFHMEFDQHRQIIDMLRTSVSQPTRPLSNETLRDPPSLNSHISIESLNLNESPNKTEPYSLEFDVAGKHRILENHIKNLIKQLAKNISKEVIPGKKFYGFFCVPCNFWTIERDIWDKHNYDPRCNSYHKKNIFSKTLSNYIKCDCYIFLYCDNEFHKFHRSSKAHSNFKSFISCTLNSISKTIPSHDTDDWKMGKWEESLDLDENHKISSVEIDWAGRHKLLQKFMKYLYNDLSRKSFKKIIPRKKNYGYFCGPCNFWNVEEKIWNSHNLTISHKNNISNVPCLKLIPCDCSILFLCNEKFHNDHCSTISHSNLKRFITHELNLISKTVPSDVKDSVYNKTVLSTTESNVSSAVVNDVSMTPTESDDSFTNANDHVSLPNDASTLKSDCKIESKDAKLRTGEESEETRDEMSKDDKCTTSFWVGLTGLSSDISDNDIQQAFKNYGVVKNLVKFDTSKVDVLIKFREEWSYKIDEIIKNHKVQIKGAAYPIRDQQSRVFNIPDNLRKSFSRSLFYIKLFINAKNNSKISKEVDGNDVLFTTIIKDDIENIEMIKGVTTIGSRATGLADADSWFDLFVNVDGISGKLLTVERKEEYGNKIKKNMERFDTIFKDIRIDENYLICTHCETGATCRIYFCDRIVVMNTELIGLYVESNEFVKSLLVTIRYWVKCCNLNNLVSSYAVAWMVLHYLISTAFVKPVQFLKANYVGTRTVSGWDCSFDSRTSILSVGSSSRTFNVLLKGFFEYYSNLEIYFNVLTPLTGHPIKKSEFQVNVSKDKPPFHLTEGLCLQDPIELCINLTENLKGEDLNKFKSLCSIMVDILTK